MGRITYANSAATIALALAATGLAVAANPGDDGVIRGCLKTGTKILRVPDSARCRKTERKLSWNQTGPPGMSEYEIVPGPTDTASDPNLTADSTASCPKGKRAVGGGFSTDPPTDVSTAYSKPFQENQWIVRTVKTSGAADSYALTAYAVCVKVE